MKNRAALKNLVLLGIIAIMILPGCATAKKKKTEQALRTRLLAEAYLREGKLPFAYRELLAALALTPKDPYIHFDLGLFYYQRKMYPQAVEAYQTAIDLKPNFSTAINNLGVVYMAENQWDKAIETLIPLTQNYAYATPHFSHYLLGQAFFHKNNYAEAIRHLQEAILLSEDYTFAHHWLGKVLLADGQTTQAIEAFEQAASLGPEVAVFYLDLGRAYFQTGLYEKAERAAAQSASLATELDLQQEALQLQNLAKKKQ